MADRPSEPYITVVIPTRNEEKRIVPTILDQLTYFDTYKRDGRVLVIDGASGDKTAEVVRAIKDKRVHCHLTHIEHGKGFCVRTGVLGATTPLIGFVDADGATPAKELEKLIDAINYENVDVAIASRAVAGATVHGKSKKRDLSSYVFNLACRALATPGIYDTQCGFKLFKREAAYDIFSRQGILGFAFDVEILYLALRLGYNIKEVGVEWHDKAGSTVNVWRDAPRMFKDVLTIAYRGRNGYYKNPCTTPKRIVWLDYKE